MIFKCKTSNCNKRVFVRNKKCKACKVKQAVVSSVHSAHQRYTPGVLSATNNNDGYLSGLSTGMLLSGSSNSYGAHNEPEKTPAQDSPYSSSKDNSHHHTSHSHSADSYSSGSSSADSYSSSSDSYSSYSSSDYSSGSSSSDW